MRRILRTLVFIFCAGASFAQETEVIERDFIDTRDLTFKESLLSIRAATLVPNVIQSQGFRVTFKGIYELNASLNMRIFTGFAIGVGVKQALISTQERIPSLDTRMQLYTGYVKFSYMKAHTQRSHSCFGLNVGYNNSFFTGVRPISSPVISKEYNSGVIEPEYSINFAVEESFSIGMFASYCYMLTPFSAKNIGLQDYMAQATAGENKSVGILNIGFCFYVGMGKRFKTNLPD